MNNPDTNHKNDSSSDNDTSQNEDEDELYLGNYILKEKIGSGAFGKVYLVESKETCKTYAIKVTRQKFDEYSEDTRNDILREINIISKLNHPHVLKYIGYSKNDFKNKQKLVIFTEYVSNGTLQDLIEQDQNKKSISTLNDTQKLIIIYGIASAMSYLHSHDIIHRDLKPSNILIDENFHPKIADFGLSKIMQKQKEDQGLKSTMETKGTPIYMSPEIWRNQKYSKKGDVYAFGIIVYEIVTNESPYENQNIFKITENIINGKRPEFKKPIPKSYKDLIESCWSQDPNDRPTFDDILRLLFFDRGFITKSVDYDEYNAYIKYIDKCQTSFKSSKNVNLNDFVNQDLTVFKVLTEYPSIFKVFSFNFFADLFGEVKTLILEAENDIDKKFLIGKSIIEGREIIFPKNTEYGIKYLKRSIKEGCLKSLVYYCELLIKGKIIPRNLKKAKKLIQSVQDKHSSIYSLLLGKILKKEGNYNEAKHFFEQSMKEKNGDAMYEYGKMLYKGIGSQVNKEEAKLYYKMAIENKCLKAMYKYAIIIKDEDFNEYLKYIKMAADNNFPKALFCYSLILEKGEGGVKIDEKESFKYLEKAAKEGHVEAMHKCALELIKRVDDERSVVIDILLYMSKSSDNINSIYDFGKFIYETVPCESNMKVASQFIRIAANNGIIDAITIYGNMLINGDGVEIDKEEGMKYLKIAIDKGDTKAMNDYGIQLIDRNEKEEALKHFEMAIKKGDYTGIGNYGKMLLENDDKSDNEEGLKYIKLAADNGNEYFANYYAEIICDDNIEEAGEYFKKASEKGNYEAMCNYGILLINGGTNQSEEGAKYLKIAADKGYVDAMMNYSQILMYGIGVPEDKKKAYEYLENAANKDYLPAILKYGKFLLEDEKECNKEKALKYFKIAADKDSPEGMLYYAHMLKKGIGTYKNKEEALKYYKKAFDKGEMTALSHYALMLYTGDGVPINKNEAVKYFKIGIDNGDAVVMGNYGMALLNNEISEEKKKEGLKYIKMAADNGFDIAMNNYACLLAEGIGVPVNLEESEKYFKMAIENGSTEALFRFGKMLFEGECFQMDKVEGSKYLKLAAERDHGEAAGMYGRILAEGDGVPLDKEEAIKFYKKGILLGDSNSMFYYGYILYYESDNPKDEEEGMKYIKLAADLGLPEAIATYSIEVQSGESEYENYYELFVNSKFANNVFISEGIKLIHNEDPEKRKKGANSIKEIADSGNADAMFLYAQILENFDEFATDKDDLSKYYKMAIEQGHKEAMFAYGLLLFNKDEDDVDVDNANKEEGLKYIKMAAKKGCPDAIVFYSDLMKNDDDHIRIIENP